MFKENPPVQFNENQIEKEDSFTDKILPFQLEYAVNVFEKKIPPPYVIDSGISFESCVLNLSDISSKILKEYEKRTGIIPGKETYEEYKKFEKCVILKIKESYEKNPATYISLIPEIIKQESLKLPEGKKIPIEPSEKERDDIGLIHFNIQDGIQGLEKFGLSEEDDFLLLHIYPLTDYKKQNDSLNIFSFNSLKEVAKLIKNKNLSVKGVVIESWIVDSPIGKRMGFHEFETRFKNFYHDETFWGQFYDQNGRLKEEEIKNFLETGVPPFKIVGGFMSKKEFLEKYSVI